MAASSHALCLSDTKAQADAVKPITSGLGVWIVKLSRYAAWYEAFRVKSCLSKTYKKAIKAGRGELTS